MLYYCVNLGCPDIRGIEVFVNKLAIIMITSNRLINQSLNSMIFNYVTLCSEKFELIDSLCNSLTNNISFYKSKVGIFVSVGGRRVYSRLSPMVKLLFLVISLLSRHSKNRCRLIRRLVRRFRYINCIHIKN